MTNTTAATAPTTRVTRIAYESTTCDRCGGSGKMPFAAWNGVCLKCNANGRGNGTVMTRKGRAAWKKVQAYREANMKVAASSLKPGDRISDVGTRRTVVSVVTELGFGGVKSRLGVEGTEGYVESWQYGRTTITTQRSGWSLPAHGEVTLWWNAEHIAAAGELVRRMSGAILTEEPVA